MKQIALLLAVAGMLVAARAAAFRNLDFEEAQTNRVNGFSPRQGGWGPISDLLPGWQLYQGGVLETNNIYFDWNGLDPGVASVIDRYFSPFTEGNYAMYFYGTWGNSVPFVLVQRGDIPPGTTLLKYRYQEHPFTVSVNGTLLPIVSLPGLAATPQEAVYNVSAFAGQDVELRLTTFDIIPLSPSDDHYLDSIQFVIEAPTLAINQAVTNLVLSWPASTTGYVVQSTKALSATNVWQTVPATPVVNGNQQSVTTNIVGQAMFYRLTTNSGG